MCPALGQQKQAPFCSCGHDGCYDLFVEEIAVVYTPLRQTCEERKWLTLPHKTTPSTPSQVSQPLNWSLILDLHNNKEWLTRNHIPSLQCEKLSVRGWEVGTMKQLLTGFNICEITKVYVHEAETSPCQQRSV
ncbi:Hypothetical predicted protein [Podarcis lilfordi]|uniref:Uncharacterized protein n=1 Tax=Podarcis lilfordi TaxID=74358 RepID=A0AA35JSS5_9SAUR|nr:Hypothetical predicted protein [Podarcis lilfordi]